MEKSLLSKSYMAVVADECLALQGIKLPVLQNKFLWRTCVLYRRHAICIVLPTTDHCNVLGPLRPNYPGEDLDQGQGLHVLGIRVLVRGDHLRVSGHDCQDQCAGWVEDVSDVSLTSHVSDCRKRIPDPVNLPRTGLQVSLLKLQRNSAQTT